jgi:hypothetical protein
MSAAHGSSHERKRARGHGLGTDLRVDAVSDGPSIARAHLNHIGVKSASARVVESWSTGMQADPLLLLVVCVSNGMRLPRLVLWRLAVIAGFVSGLTICASPARAVTAIGWGAPLLVDPQPPEGEGTFNDVSCPSTALCVVVDDFGNVVTSTDPAGGASAWKVTPVQSSQPSPLSALSDVDCLSSTFCIGADNSYQVLTSMDPSGGGATWTSQGPETAANDISCPTAQLCVGVIGTDVVVSTDPTGSTSTWKRFTIDNATEACHDGQTCAAQLTAISCASETLCVAVDDVGHAFTSTDPAAGPSGWTARQIDPSAEGIATPYRLDGVSCASVSMCAAIDFYGMRVFTSRNPTGGSAAWSSAKLPAPATGISCPSVSMCVIVDNSQGAIVSTNPTGGTHAWHTAVIDRGNALRAVSCPSINFCVAVDNVGNVIVGRAFTAATVRALLRSLLTPMGGKAKIPALLRNHGYRFSVRAPGAGKLVVSWRTPAGSRGGDLLVASAHERVAYAGAVKIRVTLTPRGNQLLSHATHVDLTAQVRFTPTAGQAATQDKNIVLTR